MFRIYPIFFVVLTGSATVIDDANPNYWNLLGQKELKDALNVQPNVNVAKNVILFLGDGMGIANVMASRVYKGQKEGRHGEESSLSFEKFPHVALSKTYSIDKQVPDSASTATAFLCGVKTNFQMLGVSARTKHKNCESMFGNEVSSILQWAQVSGKDTGIITTARVTHATPAAAYAHTPFRNWESDENKPEEASRCKDIARQLVENEPGRNINVILGGGRRHFLSTTLFDQEVQKYGLRKDGKDLVSKWAKDKEDRNRTAVYVTNLKDFKKVDTDHTDYLLGLFEYSHMQYEIERNKEDNGEPSIAEMTEKAIKILQKNPNGFFLLVEGGRIDHAHHESIAKKALEDTLAFEKAVERALHLTNQEDTLIVVTADHSHVLTINGYPARGNPILGLADISDVDHMPYTTLMYTNGRGFRGTEDGKRLNLTGVDTTADNYVQLAGVPRKDETHGGEDVAIYANGPMSHLFHGVHEQNYIAHAMAYAACIGSNKNHCRTSRFAAPSTMKNFEPNTGSVQLEYIVLVISGILVSATHYKSY
ncbi:alkaline phosphatase-like [Tachypleus tridentatus]|uniref:alkaline phosphatase-like n=1 Tax=Tachypleus tridentatus TaxID=6853 RepID=UPI003FD1CDAC